MSVTVESTSAQEPAVEFHPSAEPHLDDEARSAVCSLIERLHAHARRYGVSVLKTHVRGYIDPEEHFNQVIVREVVGLPLKQALEYWDTLETPYAEWLRSYAPERTERLLDLVTLEVTSAV